MLKHFGANAKIQFTCFTSVCKRFLFLSATFTTSSDNKVKIHMPTESATFNIDELLGLTSE